VSTGLPPSSGLGWEEKRSEVQPLWQCPLTGGYRICGTCDRAAGPGRAKTSSPGRKTVLGPSCGGAGREGEETSGSESETHLVAAGPSGCEPSGLPRRRGLCSHTSLKAADGDHLVLRPNSDGEGAGAVAQDRIGVVIEQLKGWNQAASTDPDKGGGEQLAGQGSVLELCLGKEGPETCKVFENFLTMVSTESLSFCKNSFGKTICAPKTASAGERPVSSLGCTLSPRSTKGSSSGHVAVVAHAQSASLRLRCNLSTAPFDSG
jgi:hypothetical protein